MIKIDEEFKALIPPLSAEERKGLEDSILAEGCRDALVAWKTPSGDQIIVDGHNRYEICQKHDLEFSVTDMWFMNRAEAMLWMLKNQLSRRNVSPFVRAELALKLKPEVSEKAKERMRDGAKGVMNSSQASRSVDELAKVAGVSRQTVQRTEKILEKAPASTIEAVRSGEKSINKAYNEIISKEAKEIGDYKAKALDDAKKAVESFEEAKKDKVVSFSQMAEAKEASEYIRQEEGHTQTNELFAMLDRIVVFFMTHNENELADKVDSVSRIDRISRKINETRNILNKLELAMFDRKEVLNGKND